MTEPIPVLHLESMDGATVIPLDGTAGWIRMPGSTGLRMAPVEVVSSATPGVPGSILQDTRVQERPVFIPIYGSAATQAEFLDMVKAMRAMIDPLTRNFKIVGTSVNGVREMVVRYTSGMEGADDAASEGLKWCKIGLNAIAHEPFARARADTTMVFTVVQNASPFMGVVGGTDAPWPTMLSSSAVIGSGMEITVDSEVPVYPNLELLGPMDSFSGTMSPIVVMPDGTEMVLTDQQWDLDIQAGVPALSTLVLITDPRSRSIRLDGALAAGKVSRGSKHRPFYPGLNVLDVAAPGGTSATQITLSWRDLYWSLW